MSGFEDILGSFFGGGGGPGASPFGNSIFSSFFGGGMGGMGGRRRGPKRGEDLLYPLRYGYIFVICKDYEWTLVLFFRNAEFLSRTSTTEKLPN